MVMAGADVAMLCSVLLRRWIDHIKVIEHEMEEWFVAHEYDSLVQLKGSMSQKNCPPQVPGCSQESRAPVAITCFENTTGSPAKVATACDLADTSAAGQAPAPGQRVLVLYSDERLLPAPHWR
jgi:hypothetical protein